MSWQITHWLLNLLVNMASSAWRSWSTRSHTVENHFKEANNFPWPFKSSSPWGGMKKKINHFVECRDAGNREGQINRLLLEGWTKVSTMSISVIWSVIKQWLLSNWKKNCSSVSTVLQNKSGLQLKKKSQGIRKSRGKTTLRKDKEYVRTQNEIQNLMLEIPRIKVKILWVTCLEL